MDGCLMTDDMLDLLITDATLLLAGGVARTTNLGIRGKQIAFIGDERPAAARTLALPGRVVTLASSAPITTLA